MGVLSVQEPGDAPAAWGFVAVQGALLVALVLLPADDAWVLPGWAADVAYLGQLLGTALLVVGRDRLRPG